MSLLAEYKVIDDFQIKNIHVLSLDRSCAEDAFTKDVYIDGKRYNYLPNSVPEWILLPDVYESFEGKTVEFK